MAVVGQLLVIVGVNNGPLAAGLASSQAQLKGFAGAGSAALNVLKTAAIATGVVVAAGLGLGIRAAASFQEQMAIINTVARLTPTELTKTGNAIRALSVETGTGLPDLTASFYDLVSAGIPAGQAMEFLRNATTLSIGGLSTASQAVDIITTGVNAWSVATGKANLTIADSAVVMDVFAKAIELGKLTASDIAGSIANVASQAAAMNIPIQEVGATYATLTARGIPAAQATTMLNAALLSLQRVPPGMKKLQDATGKSYEQIARTQGAQAAMQALVSDAAKYNISLIKVFGRQEGMAFALNVTGKAAVLYKDNLKSMYESSGTAASQAAERTGTFSRQMDILGASINDLFINVGTGLLPMATAFVQGVNGAVQAAGAWIASGQGIASQFAPVITAIIAKFQELLPVVLSIGSQLAPVISGIVGKFQELLPVAISIGETVMDLATRVWEGGLNKALSTGVTVIGSIVDVLGGLATAILENNDVMNILRTVADLIGQGFGLASDAVNNLLTFLGQLGDSIRSNQELMNTLAGIGDAIAAAFVAAGPAIQAVIDAINEAIALAGQAADALLEFTGGTPGLPPKPPKPLTLTDNLLTEGLGNLAGGAGAALGGLGDLIFRGGKPPSMATGGIIPGVGPQLIIGHGGEEVVPTGRRGGAVHLTHTTVLQIDGQKLGEIVERLMFNDASQYSSGFAPASTGG